MFDFSDRKIPTHQGIHDEPREPTTEIGANSSYLISQLNQFIDNVQVALNDINQRLTALEESLNFSEIVNEAFNFDAITSETNYDLDFLNTDGTLLEIFVEGINNPEDLTFNLDGTDIPVESITPIGNGHLLLVQQPGFDVYATGFLGATLLNPTDAQVSVTLGIQPLQ